MQLIIFYHIPPGSRGIIECSHCRPCGIYLGLLRQLNLVTYRHSTHFETITSEHSILGIILFPRLGPDQLVNNVINQSIKLAEMYWFLLPENKSQQSQEVPPHVLLLLLVIGWSGAHLSHCQEVTPGSGVCMCFYALSLPHVYSVKQCKQTV